MGQFLGNFLVVVLNGVGDKQSGAVGAEGAALGEEGGELLVLLGKVGRPGIHHAKAVALDLLRPQALAVPVAILVLVALQIGGLGQGVHRVGHGAPQALEVGLPGHAGVGLDDGGVILKLGHAHILHLGAHRRDALGGHKDKHVAVEEVFGLDHLHVGEGVIVPGEIDLAHLKLPPGGDLVGQVADADGGDHIPAQQLQAGEQGRAHVADGQDVDPLFARVGGGGENGLPAHAAGVHSGELSRLQGGGESLVQLQLGQAACVQHLQAVGGQKLARRSYLKGAPAQDGVALHQVVDGLPGAGSSGGVGQVGVVGGQDFSVLFVIIEHSITPSCEILGFRPGG